MLGTLLLSLLAGHRRYAHISSIRGDGVNPELLGMSKVVSEDSVRRAFQKADEEACGGWLREHLQRSYEPLLEEPWILDVDSTVKPLYGHQQGAELGYNPRKPGRPSHVYHTYFVANLRLVLEVEVQPGNQTASSYAQPALWEFVDGLKPEQRPTLLRGDVGWGSERMDTGSRAARTPLFVQVAAKPRRQSAAAAAVPRRGVGAGRRRLARSTRGLAAGRPGVKSGRWWCCGGRSATIWPSRSLTQRRRSSFRWGWRRSWTTACSTNTRCW